jgi:hypothetical protein
MFKVRVCHIGPATTNDLNPASLDELVSIGVKEFVEHGKTIRLSYDNLKSLTAADS